MGFIWASQGLHPWVGEGANPAVVLLSTTTCEKSAFSESNQGTTHRAFPVISLFKPQSQLTNDGYEYIGVYSLKYSCLYENYVSLLINIE